MTETANPEARAPGGTLDDDATAPDGDRPTEVETYSTRHARLVVGAVVLLAAGLIVGRLTASDSDADVITTTTTAGATADSFPAGDQDRSGFWGLAGLHRLVVDTFDRGDARPLGTAGTGEPWVEASGSWGIEDDQARLLEPSADRPNVAVVAEGEGDGLMELTLSVVEQGAGMVFRWSDIDNHWTFTANPSLGAWTIRKVVDGDATTIGEVTAPTVDGTTITVTQNGPKLRFLVDAREVLQIDDRAFESRLQAGLYSPAGAAGMARFDRFLTMSTTPPEDSSSTTTAGGTGGG